MSVWARNEKNRLVRTAFPRNLEESIVSQVSQDNLLPQMDNPENQQGHMSLHNMGAMLRFQ